MARYSVNGAGQVALSLLETGPASMEALRAHARGLERRALWCVVRALVQDRLIAPCGKGYRITEDGSDALRELRLGIAVEAVEPAVASVRVFARVAHA